MSKESVIQRMKEYLDCRDAFGKYIACSEDYYSTMYLLSAPSIAEEYAKGELRNLGLIMTRKELQNKFGIAICEYCRKHIIFEYNLRKGWVCEKSYCKEAQDGYAAEHNIELEEDND